MGNYVRPPAQAPPLPDAQTEALTQPEQTSITTARKSGSSHRATLPTLEVANAAAVEAARNASTAASASAAATSTAARAAVASGGPEYVAPSYPWTAVLPVVGGASLLLGGGLAYGISYGGKQATKVEEYGAEYEVKPQAEPIIDVPPEVRRQAVRRAFLAFGIGTGICVAFGVGSSYAVCRHWEVYTVREVSLKFGELVVRKKDELMTPFSDLPEYTRSWKAWLSSTRVGAFLRVSPPRAAGQLAELTSSEQAEMDKLEQEAQRMELEWENSWSGKQQAKKDAAAAAAAATTAAAIASQAAHADAKEPKR